MVLRSIQKWIAVSKLDWVPNSISMWILDSSPMDSRFQQEKIFYGFRITDPVTWGNLYIRLQAYTLPQSYSGGFLGFFSQ